MRYHYVKPTNYKIEHGETYNCDHPLYSSCTLYKQGEVGLAVIQQRFNHKLKLFWWSNIDPWLVDDIFSREGFQEYFYKNAGECTDGLYPTVTVRQIMHALKMKPLKKEWWESY